MCAKLVDANSGRFKAVITASGASTLQFSFCTFAELDEAILDVRIINNTVNTGQQNNL